MNKIHILLDEVKTLVNNNKYLEDKQKLMNLYSDLYSIESKLSMTLIEKIDSSIKELDQKYNDLFELVNMYDEIKYDLEKRIQKEMIEELRKNNRG